MPWNYRRKANPPCPNCGLITRRITQRSYSCADCGLIASYRKGSRTQLLVYGLTDAQDAEWIRDSGLGVIRGGKHRIFLREVVLG